MSWSREVERRPDDERLSELRHVGAFERRAPEWWRWGVGSGAARDASLGIRAEAWPQDPGGS